MKPALASLSLAALVALAGCAGTPEAAVPYAILAVGSGQVAEASMTRPGIVLTAVGGEQPADGGLSIAPGRHKVTIEILKTSGAPAGTTVLEVEALACTRHYLAVREPNMTNPKWEAEVVRSEPILLCESRSGTKSGTRAP